jgi:hypothetical protein
MRFGVLEELTAGAMALLETHPRLAAVCEVDASGLKRIRMSARVARLVDG